MHVCLVRCEVFFSFTNWVWPLPPRGAGAAQASAIALLSRWNDGEGAVFDVGAGDGAEGVAARGKLEEGRFDGEAVKEPTGVGAAGEEGKFDGVAAVGGGDGGED